MRQDYYNDEKEIIECYLDKDIFHPAWRFEHLMNTNDIPRHEMVSQGVELIVRPECNQKCEYCYIARHGHDLYPVNERLNNEQILKNIQMILDYCFDVKESYIFHWELFAGDLFYDNLYFDILDLFYNKMIKYQRLYPRVFQNFRGLILTPCNFSFIDDAEKTARLKEYIAKFDQDLNVEIGLSISTDGKYGVETREIRTLPDDHFDKLFQWTLEYPRNGFHPIISASNVHNAIQNYEWWKEMYDKYYGDERGHLADYMPYWLEARNDEWTEDKIQLFEELIEYMIKDRFAMCNNDLDNFTHHLFIGDGANDTLPGMNNLDLLSPKGNLDRDVIQQIGCSLSGLSVINVSNLTFVPCHRLTYKQFQGAKFEVKDDAITDIIPLNACSYINIKTHPNDVHPRCNACIYNTMCHKGCLGAQFESSGELFLPCRSVCNLEKRIIGKVISTYHKMGVLKIASDKSYMPQELYVVFDAILKDVEDREHERTRQNHCGPVGCR